MTTVSYKDPKFHNDANNNYNCRFFLLKNESVEKKYATVVQTIQLRNRYTERISNR